MGKLQGMEKRVSKQTAIRVMLADDHPIVMTGFAMSLAAQGMDVVAQARTPSEAAALYAEHTSPLVPLFERLRSAVPDSAHVAEPARWHTYLPFGASAPDRAIDHLFTSERVEVLDVDVLREHDDLSDHLPLRVRLTIRG